MTPDTLAIATLLAFIFGVGCCAAIIGIALGTTLADLRLFLDDQLKRWRK